MNERRTYAIVVGVLLLTAGAFFLRRRPAAAQPAAPLASAAAEVAEAAPAPAPWQSTPAHAAARRARDAKRAEILAALERKKAPPAPSQRPAAPAPSSSSAAAAEETPGRYEPDYIRQVFREDMFPLLKQCYAETLKRRPTLGGRLVLKFAIVGDSQVGGIVEDGEIAEESDLKDDEMQTCVRESLMALTFDKPPEGGGRVKVTYPILFAPGDDDEAAPDGGQAP